MKKTTFFLLIILFCLSAFLYKESFSSYFFQDDWFTVSISRASNISDFLNFFVPRTDVIYYRPLGMQVFFFIMQSLFGLHPFAFRVITLITHAASALILFEISKRLTRDSMRSAIISVLYATSAVFFIPYFWAATYPFILGPFLFFLSFSLYLKSKYIVSLGVFILGIMTNETVLVLPAILFFYELFMVKKKDLRPLVSFFSVAAVISAVRFLFFKPPTVGSYHLTISKEILHNLVGYIMWTFNWPEEMKAQMISFGRFNPVFISEFRQYFDIFIISLFVIVIVSVLVPGIYLIVKKQKVRATYLSFYCSVFFLGLLTVIFFPVHSFSYYLSISLFGGLLLLTEFISNLSKNKKLYPVLYLFLTTAWIMSSYFSIQFNLKVHWAGKRGARAFDLIKKALANPPKKKGIYYVPPGDENKLSLNDQDALRVILKNDSVTTVYGYPPVEPLK